MVFEWTWSISNSKIGRSKCKLRLTNHKKLNEHLAARILSGVDKKYRSSSKESSIRNIKIRSWSWKNQYKVWIQGFLYWSSSWDLNTSKTGESYHRTIRFRFHITRHLYYCAATSTTTNFFLHVALSQVIPSPTITLPAFSPIQIPITSYLFATDWNDWEVH